MYKMFIKKISLFIILALGFEPNAAAVFVELEPELSRRVSNTIDLNNGVYSIGFLNSTCTGAQISKEGHVLIARHCIEPSVSWAQTRASSPDFFVRESRLSSVPTLIKYTYDNSNLLESLKFYAGLDQSHTEVFIVTAGLGFLYPRFYSELSQSLWSMHNQLTDEGYSTGADIALVLIPSLSGKKCLKLSQNEALKGQFLKTVSYSCFKEEQGAWPTHHAAEVILDTRVEAKSIEGFRVAKGNFLVDHTSERCNSGSPVFNNHGELVGVVNVSLGRPSDDEPGLTVATHALKVLDFLSDEQKAEVLNLNEGCSFY